jgi:hypothetical protein
MAVEMVRTDAAADDSLAAMRARSKFGIAIAAMIRMIATTISNSISEKPFCFRILLVFSVYPDSLVITDHCLDTRTPLSKGRCYEREDWIGARLFFSNVGQT